MAWLRHPFRLTTRFLWMAGELALATLRFALQCSFRRADAALPSRAAWLHHTSSRLLRIFSSETKVLGPIPERGLLVCNHLSYLDVIVLGSLAPAVFVARHDVKSWPVFGWLASLAGTVYVNRERRAQVGQVADQIQSVLATGVPVILFPEGTSSDGQTVLPFKSSLLEPATQPEHPLAIGFISYELDDGNVAEEVCYWKDMTFFPHLLNLLGKRRVRASVRFQSITERSQDRKELARELRAAVLKLKAG